MTSVMRLTRWRCRQVAKVLQGYLDGELEPETTRRVHDHLEECRRCGLDATTYRAIKTAIPMARASSAPMPVDPQAVRRLRRFADELSRPDEGLD